MKKLTYFLLLTISCISCSSENIEGFIIDKVSEQEQPENTIETPCGFNLSKVKEGETITLNCLLDLENKTINLPKNVTLDYDQGDIINGTLNFADGGKIDGRLLNSSLKIEGNTQLINNTFKFIPTRWENIVEGETNFDTALKNTTEFEKLMFQIKTLGATTFEINKFNAFFEVTTVTSTTSDQNYRASDEAVNLPSNFHLKMTNETFLRMYTSAPEKSNGFILAVKNVENVTISGGNLVGDLQTRGFNTDNPGGTGALLFGIHSGKNIKFQNVHLENGSAGAITIYSLGFPFNADYNPSTGIEILNCTFKNNRRMAISLTDGREVTIKGNSFENIGQPSTNIDGGEVGYAINLEPYRIRDNNGELIEYQKVFNVKIQDNTEKNSRIGFLTIASSKNVIVENNTIETRIAYTYSNQIKIRKNKLIAPSTNDAKFAIFAAGGSSDFSFENEIYDNEIEGYGTAIAVDTKKVDIYNNDIKNTEVGIQLTNSREINIYENTISVNNIGLLSNLTTIDKVNFYNNTVEAGGFHLKLSKVNEEKKEYKVLIKENNFVTQKSISLFYANGVDLTLNTINSGISINSSSNINITSNTINPENNDGIALIGNNSAILLEKNKIKTPIANNYTCIDNTSNIETNVSLIDNTCE